MPKNPANHRKNWTGTDDTKLKKLADGNTPTRVSALKLGRTEDAVRARASDLRISLKPTNQSPYGPRKKKR